MRSRLVLAILVTTLSAAPAGIAAQSATRAIRRDIPLTNMIRRAFAAGTRDSSGRPGRKYWQLHTDYAIDARLDPTAGTITGVANISRHGWRVISDQRVETGMLLSLQAALSDLSDPVDISAARVHWIGMGEFGLRILAQDAAISARSACSDNSGHGSMLSTKSGEARGAVLLSELQHRRSADGRRVAGTDLRVWGLGRAVSCAS